MYVGSQYVHQTTDGGQSWTTISPDLSLNDKEMQQQSGGLNPENASIEYGNVIFAIAESPLEAGLIWAGTNDGLVHVTRNGGGSWTDVTANIPGLPRLGTVSNIEPSRHNAGSAYITLDLHQVNDRDPHVYKTSDYGATWESITSGIPYSMLSYAHCIREDPVRPGLLYLGTENALYVSFDDGENWQPLQSNLPPAPVHWIEVQDHFNDLVVATYGRGFWILDDLTPLQQLTPEVMESDVHLFQPRSAYRFRNITSPMSQRGDTVGGQNPQYGASINYYLRSTPEGPVSVTILNENDQVVSTLTGSGTAGINRIHWDLRSDPTQEVRLRTSPLYAPYFGVGPEGWRPLPVRGGGRVRILESPGTYTVKLTVGESELTQGLTVRKDPHSAGTEDDIAAQMVLLRDIRDSVDVAARLTNQLEWIRKQIADIGALLESDESAASLIAAGDQLDAKLIAVEENLFQMKLTGGGQDMSRWPAQLIAKMTTLASRVGGSDFPPTTQQVERAGEFREQVTTYQRALRGLIEGDLAALNAQLKANDVPHIFIVEGS